MRSLGGYTLLERIASGPSSEIYVATNSNEIDPQTFRAVKLVRPKLARDAIYVDALLKDAPAATRFRHRAAVQINDVMCAEGEVLVVQELVKARSLAEVLERGETDKKPLPRELVLWIAVEVAGLLEALHRTRWSSFGDEMMWHGALSPFDVLIQETGQISVLGCGVGHARAAVTPALDRLPYVAPELLDGDVPTPLSDIYALALMIYDALAGGRVFRRATLADTRAAITRGEAPRLSTRTDYNNAIIDELLSQSMARWPESRPQSAAYVERAFRSQVRGTEEATASRLAEHVRRAFAVELEAFERTMESARRRVRVEHESETTDMFRPLGAPSNDLAFGGVTEPMRKLEPPRAADPEVTEIPELVEVAEHGARTEPEIIMRPAAPARSPVLSAQEDLLQPTDLLADLFESIEDEQLVTPAKTEPVTIAQPPRPPLPRAPSRTPVPLAKTPAIEMPAVAPPPLPKPPPLKPRQVSSPPPRPTSTSGRVTTSGAAEVAGAPARFFEKLSALLSRYELGAEIAKAGPISGIEAHLRDSKAPVLALALDSERMDDVRLSNEEWLAVFERICSIARKVTHPLLPRMIESGTQGSVRFAVLDHSEGASLSLVIGRGKALAAEAIRKIIASAAVALQHLHERGVLFCNVQAHALWLTREGYGRLIDFSMAAPIGGPLNTLLPTNIFALSPEYLRGREYGPASDQFALGALLYELLTQTRPFRGLDTDMIIAAIRDKDPLPPHTIDSRVDRLLSDVAMRALDKDPGRRFNSMSELARLITSG